MLYFKEEKQGERNTDNYRAVRVNYEGEPNFIVDCGYNQFINIDETGDITVYDKVKEKQWVDIIDLIYSNEKNVEVVEYYQDFDITIAKRV
jgi:hypothetical protein